MLTLAFFSKKEGKDISLHISVEFKASFGMFSTTKLLQQRY